MWLWPLWVVLGFGEPWSVGCSCLLGRALLTDVRLLGRVGMLMGGWNPERSHRHCPSSGGSHALASVLRRGEERTHILCPVSRAVLLFSELTPEGSPLPPAVARYRPSFFLLLHLLDADPKAPLSLASVVLVLGLKQHWARASDTIILGSGIWSWERPGLEGFSANGKKGAAGSSLLSSSQGTGRPASS